MGKKALEEDRKSLFLGGDHSIAMGTIGGVSHHAPVGVIWVDAHGDFNTPETSPSHNIHGMPLAVLLGRGSRELIDIGRPGSKLRPKDVVLIGVRKLDSQEKALLKKSGITIFTMREIDEQGMDSIAKQALKKLDHLDRIHVSLDLDCLDPREAQGVGTPVAGGLTYREALLLTEIIADTEKLASVDLVEINPIFDEKNVTAQITVDLAVSLFGKRIL
jgi:arginase